MSMGKDAEVFEDVVISFLGSSC